MKRLIPILSCAAGLFLCAPARATDAEIAAHKSALAVAGAFSNDGFKLRDGRWTGQLQPGKPGIIQVNLYAGNAYWFTLAVSGGDSKLALTIYDETGKAMTADHYQDDAKSAAGFSPQTSGPYYLKLDQITGAPTAFCLIYSYK